MFPTSLLALLVGQIPGCRQILRSFNSSSLPPPGVVRVSLADMDRETRENYSVVIQAKDMGGQLGGLAGTTTVNITLSDINDNPPMFDQSKCRDSPMMLHLLIHRPSPFFLSPLPLPLTPPPLTAQRTHHKHGVDALCSHWPLCWWYLWHTHCSALCPSSSVHFWSSSPWTFTPWPPPPPPSHPPVTPCCLFDYPHFCSSHYDLPEVGGCRAVRRHLFLIDGWLRS